MSGAKVFCPWYHSKNQSKDKLKEKIQFYITPVNTSGFGISIYKDGVGRVVAEGCNRADGHDLWAGDLGVGNYNAHITLYNGDKWVDTYTVYFSVVDPQPSYSDFSVSQSVYSLHDKVEFRLNPINATGIGISIDKEGVGRVVAEGCNRGDGHDIWGIALGVGNYSAHITIYNDEKWVDTNTVYFSIVAPSYSNLGINKKKIGTSEDVKFNINTSNAEFMVLKVDRAGEGCVYVERCWDSLDGWSIKADALGKGQYEAYFLVFSTNDYYIETERISFSIYQSPKKSKLTCLPGDSYTKTIFQWEEAANTTYYDLRIDAADYEKGGNIKNVWQLRQNRCSVWLPVGEYAAHVDCVNEDGAVGGEIIYFTVKEGNGGTSVNIGSEVRVRILTADSSFMATKLGQEVKLGSESKDDLNQIWKFVQQGDGSYVIYSEAENGVLTASDTLGAAVFVTGYQKEENQRWNIYGDSEDGYILKSVGTGYVVGSSTGSTLCGYALKYSSDQMFRFEKANEIVIETPVVTVENLADEANNVKIKWNACQNATKYDILIYASDGKELKKKISDVETTSCILNLAAGNYYVCVQAKNEQLEKKASSKLTGFTAKEMISGCSVILEKNTFAYDGTEKKPQVRVYDVRGNILSQSEYSIVYENNTDAGTATVRLTGKNTYLGTKDVHFTINKAVQQLKSFADGKRISDGEAVDLGVNAIGKVTYKVEPENIAEVSPDGRVTAKTAGTVVVTVSAEGDKNHDSAQITARLVFEHEYDKGVITKKASCETDGERTYTCAGCKESYTEKINATGHAWNEGEITTRATCAKSGIKTYTCTLCSETKTEELPVTGNHQHTMLRDAKEASCEEEGYTGDIYCEDCGKKISSGKVIAKTAHKWDEGVVTQKATCTEKGSKTYTCTLCESTKTEELPATGHGERVIKFAKKASCKTEGYTGDIYCTDCGEMLEEGSVIPKEAHQWDAGKITKQATTTSTGIRTFTCTKCGTTKKETIPKTVPKKATPGKTVTDTATNGIYRVLTDGVSVKFVKPITKKATAKIPDTVKVSGVICKVSEISVNAFKDDTTLKTVIIGKNVKVIGNTAFYGCKNLAKVSGAGAIVQIGDRAFYNCMALSGIVLPSTVTSIGKQAFYNCRNLKSITINTLALNSKTLGTQTFTKTYTKPTVRIPSKRFIAYKSLLKAKGISRNAIYISG